MGRAGTGAGQCQRKLHADLQTSGEAISEKVPPVVSGLQARRKWQRPNPGLCLFLQGLQQECIHYS